MTEANILPATILAILKKYLVDHSSRRLNFLHWNIVEHSNMALNFVNIQGKDLNRVNNSDLVYRVVKLNNKDEWKKIVHFFNTYIVDPVNKNAVYIVRVDYLLSYLKSIKGDISKFVLKRDSFGTAYFTDPSTSMEKPLSIIDTDIQSVFLLEKLHEKYSSMLFRNEENWSIKDIREDYMTNPKFKFVLDDLGVILPVTDSLDIISRKFIDSYNTDSLLKLEQIFIRNGLSTVISRFSCSDAHIITVRVYIQLFLKKYCKKRK